MNEDWGIYRQNWEPRRAAHYIHNMTKILEDDKDAPEFEPDYFDYEIAGASNTTHNMLLQKSDGTFALIVWGEAFVKSDTDTVTVTLNEHHGPVTVYDVTSEISPKTNAGPSAEQHVDFKPEPIMTVEDGSEITFSVRNQPIIILFEALVEPFIEVEFADEAGNGTQEIVPGGEVVSVKVHHNNNVSGELIVAMYEGDVLTGVQRIFVATEDYIDGTAVILTEWLIPDSIDASQVRIKAFFWSSFETITPLIKAFDSTL